MSGAELTLACSIAPGQQSRSEGKRAAICTRPRRGRQCSLPLANSFFREGPRVRKLPAGGRRIRTLGPPSGRTTLFQTPPVGSVFLKIVARLQRRNQLPQQGMFGSRDSQVGQIRGSRACDRNPPPGKKRCEPGGMAAEIAGRGARPRPAGPLRPGVFSAKCRLVTRRLDLARPDPSAAGGGAARRAFRLSFAGLLTTMAVASLDQNIVSTALPRIVGELGGLSC